MPIIVKDFTWRQTETLIIIHVPLHGIHQSKVDLLTSSMYIKASYAQFFFEVFLLHSIKSEDSKCILTSSEIIFELLKEEPIISWSALEADISKKAKMALKLDIIKKEHESVQNKCEQQKDKKCQLKREAVSQQISLDTRQRKTIDKIRNEEKVAAIGDLQAWNKKPNQPQIEEISSDEDEDITSSNKNLIKAERNIKTQQIRNVFRNRCPNFKNNKSTAAIPFPRTSGVLKVDFTARQFPTPSRESQLDEENEWLKKQVEVRRSVGFLSEDLRAEEKNPQYLNSKGLEFLKSGNYLGAISAFSFGIKLSEKFSDLYVNRSKAHFEIGNYYKSAQDCSTALDLLQPVVSANYNIRVECIVRRGMSLCKLEYLREGITELEAAYKLRPDDDSIKIKLCEAIDKLNSTSEDSQII